LENDITVLREVVCDVRILIVTGLGLDHEGGNSKQEKRCSGISQRC